VRFDQAIDPRSLRDLVFLYIVAFQAVALAASLYCLEQFQEWFMRHLYPLKILWYF
jgi:hypothetical protein